MNDHWFEPLADHLGSAYLRYSFTKGTVNEVDAIRDFGNLADGARILDVGCGPGRHSLEFARRGFDVTGVDVSHTFVELARQAVAAEGLDRCRFIRADARKIGAMDLGQFDLVVSLCQGAFGLTGGPADGGPPVQDRELDEPIMAAMAGLLGSDGMLVVSAFSAYFQLHHANTERPSTTASAEASPDTFDADSGVNHEWTTILDPDGRPVTAELWTTCYTPRELRLMARAVGLRPLSVYGVTPGGYGPWSPSLDCPEFLLTARRNRTAE